MVRDLDARFDHCNVFCADEILHSGSYISGLLLVPLRTTRYDASISNSNSALLWYNVGSSMVDAQTSGKDARLWSAPAALASDTQPRAGSCTMVQGMRNPERWKVLGLLCHGS